jgi:hypothetical protein
LAEKLRTEVTPELDGWAHRLAAQLFRNDLSPGQWDDTHDQVDTLARTGLLLWFRELRVALNYRIRPQEGMR